ncbi:MAG: desulfoferrodoxin family protein [Bacteroidota bacterium]
MKTKKIFLLLSLVLLLPLNLLANKTTVELIAPEKAKAGDNVTVKINISHSGNSFLHYTEWVYLMINDEEVKRWEYSSSDRPEDSDFTLEYTFEIEKTVDVEVKGNCNLHGSDGVVKKTIMVE